MPATTRHEGARLPRRVASTFLGVVDWFIAPEVYGGDADVRRRARMLVGGSLLYLLVAPIFILEQLTASLTAIVIDQSLNAIIVLNLVLLKWRRSLKLSVAFVLVGAFLDNTALLYITGGVTAPAIPWTVLTPLLTALLAGLWWGVAHAGVLILVATAFYLMPQLGMDVPVAHDNATYLGASWINFASATAFAAIIGYLFESMRTRVEEALQASEEKYRVLVEGTQDILISTDMEGRIRYLSPRAARLVPSVGDAIGRSMFELIHSEDRARVAAGFERDAQLLDSSPTAFRVTDVSGRTRWFEDAGSFQRDAAGRPLGYVGVLRDITDRKEAEGRIRREVAEKNDFMMSVSHDMSAPLRNIMGMVDSITRRHGDGLAEPVVDRLARVRRNAKAALGLIDELLELSRIHTRRGAIVEVDVGDAVRSATDRLAQEIETKGIRLVVAETWPVIWCERERLVQVFQNLVDNAVKYMGARDDARIEVRWTDEPTRHVFSVSDNGAGIAPEEAERLFRVFRRGAAAATSGAEGKGVGLAAVRAIAHNYDGEAWLDSRVGEGCTFFFSLAKERVRQPPEAQRGAS